MDKQEKKLKGIDGEHLHRFFFWKIILYIIIDTSKVNYEFI